MYFFPLSFYPYYVNNILDLINNITLIIPEIDITFTNFKTLGLFSFLRFAMGIFLK